MEVLLDVVWQSGREGYHISSASYWDRQFSYGQQRHWGIPHLITNHVFQLHRLLERIISDCDPKFLSKYWDELFAHLGTDLWFSMAFHPQTDGQSEATNWVMENF